jgi:tetratricopeptide (TPR) repeat protein
MAAAAYSYLGASGQILPHKAFEIVHRYADKALQIDSAIAESHIAKASAYLFYDWKWEEAHESLQKAIKINPAAIEAYELLGFYNAVMGNKKQAVEYLKEAERLDPLSPVITESLGNMYLLNYRFEDALRQADKLLAINPQMRIAIEMKGWATGMKGDWKAALEYFEEVHRLTGHPLKGLMGCAFAYGKLGLRDKALECIAKMEQRHREEPDSVVDADLANAWFGLGELDKAFYYLNQCVDKRMQISFYLEYPTYEEIKKDPRYKAIKERMGL